MTVSPEINQNNETDWTKILSVVWIHRKQIALVTAVLTVIAIGVVFLLPENFRSTAIVLPDSEKNKLSGLSGFSDLIENAGISWGGDKSPAKLYPTIINSESVLKNIIYSEYETKKLGPGVNLIQFWSIKEKTPELDFERALAITRGNLDVVLDNKTNVLTISILTTEPELSAEIVNKLTGGLDKFLRTRRISSATEQRKWIESRLVEVKDDLKKAENRLKEYREQNRRITDSPQLLLEQERLVREVAINSTMYVELKKQLELVKIEEIKNIPIVNVMDPARPAAKKESPKRIIIVGTTFLLALAGATAYRVLTYRYSSIVIAWRQRLWRSAKAKV